MRTETALVTASGSVIGQGIMKCLRFANAGSGPVRYKIIATDASPLAAGLYRGDSGLLIPGATEPGYVDAVVSACRKGGAAALFAGSDEELAPLSRAAARIERESGARVVINPPAVVDVCSDKWATFVALNERGVRAARSADPSAADAFASEVGFPLVVKPRGGHGSLGFHSVRDREELSYAVGLLEQEGLRPMLQEYVGDPDQEYTTGVSLSRGGAVISSIAMKRTLKAGQTYKAFIDSFDGVRAAAEKVALALGARGPINIQSRTVDGEQVVFDVNPRFSASCPMRAVAGVNEPDILFRDFVLGERMKVDGYQRLVSMRYWNEVYVRAATYEKARREGRFQGPDSVVLPYF